MMKALGMAVPAVLLAGCASAPPPEPAKPEFGSILRVDPAFDTLIPNAVKIEKVAGGFSFTEGPLWRPDGRPWFSDLVWNKWR
jgi:gluconolactonase